MIGELCEEFAKSNKKKTIKKMIEKDSRVFGGDCSRILRSFHKKHKGEEMGNAKNFSYVSTRIYTSQVNGF